MESSVTSKGQTTIPKEIRERWGLKAGDKVRFFFHPSGHLAVLPVRPISELRGVAKGRAKTLAIEDMDRAVTEAVTERNMRSRR